MMTPRQGGRSKLPWLVSMLYNTLLEGLKKRLNKLGNVQVVQQFWRRSQGSDM
jgi:hypothetical protein